MAIIKKFTKRGFTLIELMIVVVIIGILASLAIYGVQKYVANSKSAEAKTMLGRMAKDMMIFYEGENQNYKILAFGSSAGITRALCPAATVVPTTQPSRAKGMPDADSFNKDGWACLGTTWSNPTYYQYQTKSSQTGSFTANTLNSAVAGESFTAIATGDLDGDNVLSTFNLGGTLVADSGQLALVLATTIEEINPEE